ncbi:MAG TPA: tRNA lysidine(34) synthetase TilS [bacterium]|nr:tRNA lysidine(34) synthetase TilS [bacterium]HPN45436.1 tRNA lysidine(34) synthetase TilS [bacterium]
MLYNQKYSLFAELDTILVALSGGIDSMVLLHVLLSIRKELHITVVAAHLNHQLRGDEADSDETFVQKVCQELDIPLVTQQCDVRSWCRDHKLSLETGARDCRYRFLQQTAEQLAGRVRIATAHNANDNAETILDHIMRGSGTKGLRGILPKRDIYIRPLLFASRQAIEHYAAGNNLDYRVDSTNSDTRYRRNRIRHTLLPLLAREFNPQIISSLNRLGASMTEVEDFLISETVNRLRNCLKFKDEHKIILDIDAYLAYFNILQKGILAHALELLGTEPGILDYVLYEKLSRIIQKRRSGVTLPVTEQINITIYGNELVFWRQNEEWRRVQIPAKPGHYSVGNDYIFEIKEAEKPLNFQNKSCDTEWIDADKIVEPLILRSVLAGDRFYPVNGRGNKKVSDYFIDEKIPVYERRQIPLLVCSSGIVWLAGKRLDDRFKVTANTQRVYQIRLVKTE